MLSAVMLLLAAAVLVVPPLSVVGLVTWARRLRVQGAHRLAIWVAYVLAAIVGLVIVYGYVGALLVATHALSGESVDPSQKARGLAEGISELMNCEALALLVALLGSAGLGVWRLRQRR